MSKQRPGRREGTVMSCYCYSWQAALGHASALATLYLYPAVSDNGCTGRPCDQHLTAENILDNFCRADFGQFIL